MPTNSSLRISIIGMRLIIFVFTVIILVVVLKNLETPKKVEIKPIPISPTVPIKPDIPVIPDDSVSPNPEIDRIFGRTSGSIAVIKDGDFIYKKGYGSAGQDQNTAYTNYRMASVSKQFTAMAIMICKERGLLSYGDNLQKFFPGFPDYGRGITVRHLLTHTSGLPRDGGSLVSGTVTDRKIVEALKNSNRSYRPGGFSYCNVGYCVLAVVVEVASGQDYPDFMQEHVFNKLGMVNSTIYEDGKEIKNRAYGQPTDQNRSSKTWGDGCVYTSVHDYFAWDQCFYKYNLVSKETIDEALTPHKGGYGFGWFIGSYKGMKKISHTGSTVGFRTAVQRYPEKGLAVVVFCNSSGASPSSIATRVANLYL